MGLHNHSVRGLYACALMIVACALPAHADMVAPRIRPVGNRITALLERGYAVSPTLAILVDALEHTDIIVHVTECWLVDGAYSGDTSSWQRPAVSDIYESVSTCGCTTKLRLRC
jgi:hypothetical protein